jgi:C-terminal processing protease CtpA/Prc
MQKKIWLSFFLSTTFLSACGGSTTSSSEPIVVDNSPKPLEIVAIEQKIPQLANFARIAANVQFFHPSDGVENTKWDEFIQYGMYRMAKTGDTASQVATLKELFGTMAPNVRFNDSNALPKLPENVNIVYWENYGFEDQVLAPPGSSLEFFAGSPFYSRSRVRLNTTTLGKDSEAPQNFFSQYKIGDIQIDQALMLLDDSSALGKASATFVIPRSVVLSKDFNNPYQCLVAASKTWAAIHHFWPYFKDIPVAWNDELEPLLRSCASKSDVAKSLNRALRLALTKLQDNHVGVFIPNVMTPNLSPELSLEIIEGKVVVVYVGSSFPNIQLGDEVLAIDDVPVSQIVERERNFTLKNEGKRDSTVVHDLLARDSSVNIKITVKHQNDVSESLLVKADKNLGDIGNLAFENYVFIKNPLHQILPNKLHYVNLSQMKAEDYPSIWPKLVGAPGVILDLRTYPQGSKAWKPLIGHFSPNGLISHPSYFYLATDPLLNKERNFLIPRKAAAPSLPTFSMPVVALSSRYSQSQNETALSYAQAANIPIVGEVTSGITGEINYVIIDGVGSQFFVSFTGMNTRQNNGSRFIGVGNTPDVLVHRTVNGIRTKKDEILDAASEHLLSKIKN